MIHRPRRIRAPLVFCLRTTIQNVYSYFEFVFMAPVSAEPGGSIVKSGALHAGDDSHSTRRDRERRRCREIILASAVELIGHQGYQKTSMKDIADRADMSVGKLYSYFTGKEEIFRKLLETYVEEMRREGDASCRPDDPPVEQLRCRLAAAIRHFKKHLDFFLIYTKECPIYLEGSIRGEIERNRETIEVLCKKAMERGDVRRMDPAVLAAILVGAVHELLHLYMTRRNVECFDDVPGVIDRLIIEPLLGRPELQGKE